jgi:hypothetical protein
MFRKNIADVKSFGLVIERLKFFSNITVVISIISLLCKVNPATTDNDIDKIRKSLNILLTESDTQNNTALGDACYNTLLALAKFRPLNATCVITQEPIDKINTIYTSTGHQFDTNKIKRLFPNLLAEELQLASRLLANKRICNPYTQEIFSIRDKFHILAIASRSRIAEARWFNEFLNLINTTTTESNLLKIYQQQVTLHAADSSFNPPLLLEMIKVVMNKKNHLKMMSLTKETIASILLIGFGLYINNFFVKIIKNPLADISIFNALQVILYIGGIRHVLTSAINIYHINSQLNNNLTEPTTPKQQSIEQDEQYLSELNNIISPEVIRNIETRIPGTFR